MIKRKMKTIKIWILMKRKLKVNIDEENNVKIIGFYKKANQNNKLIYVLHNFFYIF